ncbi:hypothetical protein GCM10022408_24600 [Hymenobacter fastidiosus]|uniref:Uncharacterized protein n=1 Tax=Hymenobacter fastidiosus TaxID=486264 RepID=A0ABP7SFX6_9BACT
MNKLILTIILSLHSQIDLFAGSGSDRYIDETGEGGPLAFLMPFVILIILAIVLIGHFKGSTRSKSEIRASEARAKADDEARASKKAREDARLEAIRQAELLSIISQKIFCTQSPEDQSTTINEQGELNATLIHEGEYISQMFSMKGGFIVERFWDKGNHPLRNTTIIREDITHATEANGYVWAEDPPDYPYY